jgi:anhydro-N-acetylmuramic acid kinase
MTTAAGGPPAARSCPSCWPPAGRSLSGPAAAQEHGRDLFHADWLERHLQQHAAQAAAADVQATLTEFTAASCAHAVQRFGRGGTELLVCGGGALNTHLMQRLAALLPGVKLASTAERGLPPLEVEAAAFAWLARQCLLGLPGNLASVTGASGPRILGAIHPA